MPWHELAAPDGWRLELFEDARGFFYPRRWRTSGTEWVSWHGSEISEGLQKYAFRSPEVASHYAYRERLQRQIVNRMEELRALRPAAPGHRASRR